jgi:hypothetical protein
VKGPQQPTSALYVRLPAVEADKLDRAAQALGMAKKDLVTGLVANYVDPDSGEGLTALGRAVHRHQIMVDIPDPQPPVGRITFSEPFFPEVLSPEQVGSFLQTPTATVIEMAARGELPGRQIAGEWRFSRQAIIHWLGSVPTE